MKRATSKGLSAIELLVSLLVIGIISSIVIPRFVKSNKISSNAKTPVNLESIEYRTKWKTVYRNINQAGQILLINNSQTFSGLCMETDCWRRVFGQYLSSIDQCSGNVVNKCWHDRNNWKYLNGANITTTFGEASGMVLIDGSYIVFAGSDSRCPNSICATIYVDINGPNLPNTIGLDIFLLNITNNNILPYGAGTLSADCKELPDNTAYGLTCAAKYITY